MAPVARGEGGISYRGIFFVPLVVQRQWRSWHRRHRRNRRSGGGGGGGGVGGEGRESPQHTVVKDTRKQRFLVLVIVYVLVLILASGLVSV